VGKTKIKGKTQIKPIENAASGVLGGLGVGFIALAIARYATGEW